MVSIHTLLNPRSSYTLSLTEKITIFNSAMSITSSDTTTQPPVLSPTQDALNLLISLGFRRSNSILDKNELDSIDKLLQTFTEAPALRTNPSKKQLLASVSALLPLSASMVSAKFNNPQLAARSPPKMGAESHPARILGPAIETLH